MKSIVCGNCSAASSHFPDDPTVFSDVDFFTPVLPLEACPFAVANAVANLKPSCNPDGVVKEMIAKMETDLTCQQLATDNTEVICFKALQQHHNFSAFQSCWQGHVMALWTSGHVLPCGF